MPLDAQEKKTLVSRHAAPMGMIFEADVNVGGLAMTREDAIQRLHMVLEYYNNGTLPLSEGGLRLYEFAAYYEPAEYLAMLPDSLRREQAKIAARPRRDYLLFSRSAATAGVRLRQTGKRIVCGGGRYPWRQSLRSVALRYFLPAPTGRQTISHDSTHQR